MSHYPRLILLLILSSAIGLVYSLYYKGSTSSQNYRLPKSLKNNATTINNSTNKDDNCYYISDDLGSRSSCQIKKQDEKYILNRMYKHFSGTGVKTSSVEHCFVATAFDEHDEPLLVRCTLNERQLSKFVQGEMKTSLDFESAMSLIKGDDLYGNFMSLPPYNIVKWWPPSKSSYKDIDTYKATTKFDVEDVKSGTPCYIFIDRKKNYLYFLSW